METTYDVSKLTADDKRTIVEALDALEESVNLKPMPGEIMKALLTGPPRDDEAAAKLLWEKEEGERARKRKLAEVRERTAVIRLKLAGFTVTKER